MVHILAGKISEKLKTGIKRASGGAIPLKALVYYRTEILYSMDVPWSNGFIEGCDNKTKVLKRVCFGMRNFSNFRKRILFCHT